MAEEIGSNGRALTNAELLNYLTNAILTVNVEGVGDIANPSFVTSGSLESGVTFTSANLEVPNWSSINVGTIGGSVNVKLANTNEVSANVATSNKMKIVEKVKPTSTGFKVDGELITETNGIGNGLPTFEINILDDDENLKKFTIGGNTYNGNAGINISSIVPKIMKGSEVAKGTDDLSYVVYNCTKDSTSISGILSCTVAIFINHELFDNYLTDNNIDADDDDVIIHKSTNPKSALPDADDYKLIITVADRDGNTENIEKSIPISATVPSINANDVPEIVNSTSYTQTINISRAGKASSKYLVRAYVNNVLVDDDEDGITQIINEGIVNGAVNTNVSVTLTDDYYNIIRITVEDEFGNIGELTLSPIICMTKMPTISSVKFVPANNEPNASVGSTYNIVCTIKFAD